MSLVRTEFELIPTKTRSSEAYSFDAGLQWQQLINCYPGATPASAHSQWFYKEPQAEMVALHVMFRGSPVSFPAGSPSAIIRPFSYYYNISGLPVFDHTWPAVPASSGVLGNLSTSLTSKWNALFASPEGQEFQQIIMLECFGKGDLFYAKINRYLKTP